MIIPDKEILLDKLPPYQDQWIVINDDQDVNHIIFEILDAHKEFAPLYDQIALYFNADSVKEICKKIYRFCKDNLEYVEETEQLQSTSTPAGLLTRGHCDCKGYSSFTAGILDAIKRLTGKKIDWSYRFASYHTFDKAPHHVFVVVKDGNEIWIDPTPGANKKQPSWIIDKNVKTESMPLMRNIAGVGMIAAEDYDFSAGVIAPIDNGGIYTDQPAGDPGSIPIQETFVITEDLEDDATLSQETKDAISLLYQYGIIDADGNINDQVLFSLMQSVSPDLYQRLSDARYQIEQQMIGGFFSNIWRGVKKVSLTIPRNAYLSLVALNVFGTATKIAQAIQTPAGKKELGDKWFKLGGNPDKLFSAATSGAKKKRILGIGDPSLARIGAAPVIPAWVAAATAIIAALTPVINGILRNQQSNVATIPGYDPSLAYSTGTGGTDFLGWIKSHPIESAGIALLAYLAYKKFFNKRAAA